MVVLALLRGMPEGWTKRHRSLLCWLMGMQALFPGRTPRAALGPLDTCRGDGGALAPGAHGDRLRHPGAGGMVGAAGPADLATP
jgi:hypothetical protein